MYRTTLKFEIETCFRVDKDRPSLISMSDATVSNRTAVVAGQIETFRRKSGKSSKRVFDSLVGSLSWVDEVTKVTCTALMILAGDNTGLPWFQPAPVTSLPVAPVGRASDSSGPWSSTKLRMPVQSPVHQSRFAPTHRIPQRCRNFCKWINRITRSCKALSLDD